MLDSPVEFKETARIHEYLVELRISGKELDPAAITKELKLQPSTVRRVGDLIGSKRVELALWGYNGSDSEETLSWNSLDDGLMFLLNKLNPVRSTLEQYKTRHTMIFWCGHFQSSFDGGPTLSASLFRALGELGVPVFIDNYFSAQ